MRLSVQIEARQGFFVLYGAVAFENVKQREFDEFKTMKRVCHKSVTHTLFTPKLLQNFVSPSSSR